MALPGQLQYFPLRHLIGAGLGILLLLILVLLPDSGESTKQQTFVIDLPEVSEPDTPPPVPEPDWEETTVKSGDSLSVLFSRENLSAVDVIDIAAAVPRDVINLKVGQTVRWVRTADNRISQLEIILSPLARHSLEREDDGTLSYELVERTADYIPRFASATIDNSLYYDGSQAGVPDQILYQLAAIFGWDIDFALDIRKGDSFSLIFEEVQLDGEQIGYGDILIAQFNNRDRELTAVRYVDSDGQANYFTPEGTSMRKAFLRNPIDYFRISSRFNPNRKHPILNTIRAHRGTDYAAPTGTPIKAAGDGKVTFASRNGGYGNVVVIQHGQRYQTKYAHMSKFGRGVRVGRYVKQGQIIGYVGTTGASTGPHLHYEFLVDGVHRDSLRVRLPKAESIKSSEKAAFMKESNKLTSWLKDFSVSSSTDGDFQ
ncbi:MAG: peptidase M23 [Thalassolituus maritimus]|jgi:murein DD-endopeptidase MepM/ murein hydrolase activator NlpD|nr:MAG: peptidase M23 [Thalassolituus maritimus]